MLAINQQMHKRTKKNLFRTDEIGAFQVEIQTKHIDCFKSVTSFEIGAMYQYLI